MEKKNFQMRLIIFEKMENEGKKHDVIQNIHEWEVGWTKNGINSKAQKMMDIIMNNLLEGDTNVRVEVVRVVPKAK